MNIKQKAFTLVELLVVITILAILSVVAYQSFGWATDKAQNVTKKANIANLKGTLENFYVSEHYYPMPQKKTLNNLWWYDSTLEKSTSNIIKVNYDDQEILSIQTWATDTYWGWIIFASWSTTKQIWAKWVIWTIWSFNKKYLKESIYDTQLWDIKLTWETDKKMIDYWIWKYTYAVYARKWEAHNQAIPSWNIQWNRWTYYELATTLKDIDWEWYKTFLTSNYSKDNFSNISDKVDSLIWLKQDEKDLNVATTVAEQWIPYPIDNFAK